LPWSVSESSISVESVQIVFFLSFMRAVNEALLGNSVMFGRFCIMHMPYALPQLHIHVYNSGEIYSSVIETWMIPPKHGMF